MGCFLNIQNAKIMSKKKIGKFIFVVVAVFLVIKWESTMKAATDLWNFQYELVDN